MSPSSQFKGIKTHATMGSSERLRMSICLGEKGLRAIEKKCFIFFTFGFCTKPDQSLKASSCSE
jgi:hypothetical protein